jgi:hypothetical protein
VTAPAVMITAAVAWAIVAGTASAMVLAWATHTRLAAAVAWARRRYTSARPVAAWQEFPDGSVWRPCHTTVCAHLTTIHTPEPDGSLRCTGCGHTRKEGPE